MDYNEEVCRLKHQLIEQRLEMIDGQVKDIYDKIDGVELKVDDILKWQQDQYKLQIALLVAIIVTLIGVFLGRALDFGIFA